MYKTHSGPVVYRLDPPLPENMTLLKQSSASSDESTSNDKVTSKISSPAGTDEPVRENPKTTPLSELLDNWNPASAAAPPVASPKVKDGQSV